MTSGEASLLTKLEVIEHNQKKIMNKIIAILTQFNNPEIVIQTIKDNWAFLDQELKENKKLKAQAKRNGYSL